MAGGIEVYKGLSVNGILAHYLNALCLVSVNVYVLISSYFLVDTKFRISQVLHITLQTWFYSWIILLLFKLSGQEIVSLRNALFPISFAQNWFITEYIGMYILFPFLNKAIHSMNKKQHFKCIIAFCMLLSVWSDIVPSANPFGVNPGANTFWFIALYLIGSYIKLYVDVKKWKNKATIAYFCASTFVLLSWVILTIISSKVSVIEKAVNYYYRYNCILVVVASTSLFVAFLSMDIKGIGIINTVKMFTPLTLGVYLIHDNPNIRNIIWTKLFPREKLVNTPVFILQIIERVLLIFVICALLDAVRKCLLKLFENSKYYKLLLMKLETLFNRI